MACTDPQQRPDAGSEGSDTYIHDYESVHNTGIIRGRTLEKHGAFFLPYLRPDMNVLDCGCGPGTISLGLAKIVPSGEVVGIDIESSQLDIARSSAAEFGISNATFEVGNVYQLSFSDNRFDAVFSHALFEHLNDPVTAFKEIHRVLKPGGLVGVRTSEWSGTILSPSNEDLKSALDIYLKFRQERGGNPFIGQTLRALLREAGFVDTEGSASYECWGTKEGMASVADVLIGEFADQELQEQAVRLGWADKAHFERTAEAIRDLCRNPDSIFAHAWFEAVGRKE